MLGIVYTDSGVDKLIKFLNGTFTMDIPSNIHTSEDVLDVASLTSLAFFRNSFFTSRNLNLFRFVNVNIVQDDDFNIYETPTYSIKEKMIFVSADDANMVAYRGGSYQVVTTASLITSEIINLGSLSFADMQTVMTQANTLTSPQIKYIIPVGNDTITISEIT